MSRLRRQSHCAHSIPVAAEVLESRSLLSAGAAAVHAATQHAAALHPAQHHSNQAKIPAFKGTVVAAETITGDPLGDYRGADISVASFSPTVGANVSATFKILNGNISITGTFKGQITAVNPILPAYFEYDVQDVGSLTFTDRGQKFTAAADGTPLKLYYSKGVFAELKVNVVFPATAGGGFDNLHYHYDVTSVVSFPA
jgi:hypothetical protein